MIIRYDWNTCNLDQRYCVRGSKLECPEETMGSLAYCQHFHIDKKEEDVER